ncbi:MAG: hypothetical protein A3F95_00825 [Candidatus Nealsonbacteria bacterium RIFCSPLOWO2_12_FULL_39_31]|uniref:Baseplate protein J-like domain-containing protein n=2 Tax=Candidatus Nealsoniibacteriota TaxID=1817911 RepID=A0A1G2EML1_9BACT|nr:MAG: hypothetical protein US88_C0007G0023 [Parcubacteria group bacterium GW2011_GWA2_38_27]KKQ98070.1 MAG: hypothetical protein UT22_C0005G0026 [Parcubacteria group bacterium GW2011_GWC2_39_11]OGZ19437.1 MAG: hypothetical protein A2626_01185 [Candidatus Nealsonbacteria bacterium RIFCSPHIGHO2_01_FULL_38_55]OGZ21481.1 MAG: hypothetical protein A3C48_00890 [Candidatus Nealsonbacteria bacterium RIFCSPHIGHO2_02_FULL_38_75]OGZ22604.1 MAG: hypothetical protein A2981_01685 [Candidatus Nealsonbacteri
MAKKIYDIIPPVKTGTKKEKADLRVQAKIKTKPKKIFWKYFLILLAFIVLIGVTGQLWFSGIKIKIQPKTEEISFETKVIADLNINQIDFGAGIIPGQILQIQKSVLENFLSTGKKMKEEKAKGVIRVYNGYSESSRILVPSRFVSSDGKLFWSVKKTIILGAIRDSKGKLTPGYADIEVEAAEPGEEYNIEPTTFAMPALAGTPLYSSIYGKSFSAMKGGISEEIIEVARQDVDSAKDSLIKKIQGENSEFLKANFSEEFIIIEGSFFHEILETKSSSAPGTEADSFEAQANVKTTAMAIAKKNLEKFSRDSADLNAIGLFEIEDGIVFTPRIREGGLEESFTIESIDSEKGTAVLVLRIRAVIFADSELPELKKAVFGKSAKETELFFNNLGNIELVEIKYWPFWVKTAPESAGKIAIDFK